MADVKSKVPVGNDKEKAAPARRWRLSKECPFHVAGIVLQDNTTHKLYTYTDEEIDAFIEKYPDTSLWFSASDKAGE